MDHKEIRELAALMKEMGLTSLEYRGGGESVKLTRLGENTQAAPPEVKSHYIETRSEESDSIGTFSVKSPMVGVFYSSPGADEGPYVSVGDTVHTGDVLCIIEAMKIMNEITAERDGIIAEICVENKQIVEFGQPLFRIGTPK